MKKITMIITFFLYFYAIFILENIVVGNDQDNDAKIEHTITYSREGTRSEARHGHLTINGNEIPDIFNIVICGKEAYKYYQRRNIWGRDGYFPIDLWAITNELSESDKEITDKAVTLGWYRGVKRLKNTPRNWIYVEWSKGRAFVSPDKTKKLSKAFSVKKISRFTIPTLRFPRR